MKKCNHDNDRVVYEGPHKRVLKCNTCLHVTVVRKPVSIAKMRRPVEDKMLRQYEVAETK